MIALVYVALGGVVQIYLHRPWPVLLSARRLGTIWVWGSTLWLIVHVVARRRGGRESLSAVQFFGAVLLASLAFPVQITFQSLKQSLGRERGFPWDPALAALDLTLHGGPAWHWFSFVLDNPTLLKTLDILYVAWFPALLGVLIWLCWTPQRRLRQRALVALLLLWTGAGTLGAWTFASAGPCYRAAVDPDAALLLSRLDHSESALLARGNQNAIWEAFEEDRWLPFGGVSAMPSLHVGFAVLVAIMMWHRSRKLGIASWVYAGLVHVGAVVLGWHYAIDSYAGALCACAAWQLAGRLVAGERIQQCARADQSSSDRVVHAELPSASSM